MIPVAFSGRHCYGRKVSPQQTFRLEKPGGDRGEPHFWERVRAAWLHSRHRNLPSNRPICGNGSSPRSGTRRSSTRTSTSATNRIALPEGDSTGPDDWSVVLSGYLGSDLLTAGMPRDASRQVLLEGPVAAGEMEAAGAVLARREEHRLRPGGTDLPAATLRRR